MSAVELLAEQFARRSHGETLNKHDGERYILHVERVVAHLRRAGADPVIIAVGWLHDVVEDCDVTLDRIEHMFGSVIAEAVDAITHRPNETRANYYARVGPNRIALSVKLADGRDNQDPCRKAALAPQVRERLDKKYDEMNNALLPHIVRHLKGDQWIAKRATSTSGATATGKRAGTS